MFVPRKAREHNWKAIAECYDAGHSVKECRERFGFSNRAWTEAVKRGDVRPRHDRNGRPPGHTRAAVRALLAEGLSRAEIARRLNVSRPTVTYHVKLLEGAVSPERYDWDEVQRYYDEGHSITECQARFGFARATFMAAVKRGDVVSRPPAPPVSAYLVQGQRRNRGNLKRRLIAAGLKEPSCEVCGISDWQGRPIVLALHHRNGDGRDNRLENLELLCPNCHSQTENFAGRNAVRNGGGSSAAC
jgi:transposase-like protein